MSPKRQHKRQRPEVTVAPRVILRKLLLRVLYENCSSYDWFGPTLEAVKQQRWKDLYDLCTTLGTAVYPSAAEHFAAVQISVLVTKGVWKSNEIGLPNPRDTAIKTFLASEERCRKSNIRLRFERARNSRFMQYIDRARQLIEGLIGQSPYEDLDWIQSSKYTGGNTPYISEISKESTFSSGANIEVHGNATNLFRKLQGNWTVTPTAIPYVVTAFCSNEQLLYFLNGGRAGAIACIDRDRASWRKDFVQITYNKVSFVPKNAKTHRAIAVEPVLNSFIQKGVEKKLRRLLRKWGIDLKTGQSLNAEMARLASIHNDLATLDLRAASDSISIALVKLLLPPSWFAMLDAIRSPAFKLDRNNPVRSEKFMSMGNGFCFPLQTLIFSSLIRAVREIDGCEDRRMAVYGDDIICPSKIAARLTNVLAFCGLEVNRDKSFVTGPFRESCGADWYRGQDVRPVFLDYPLLRANDVMIFHNVTLRSERTREFFSDETRALLRSYVVPEYSFFRPEQGTGRWRKAKDLLELKNLNGAFTVPHDIFMSCKWAKWHSAEHRWSWREFLFSPVSDACDDDDPNPVRGREVFELAQNLQSVKGNSTELSLRYIDKRTTRMI